MKTHFLYSVTSPPPENRFVYEIMWKNLVEPERQMTIRRMRIACWIPKATDTHSELCNTYCFSTATVIARTRLNVTLYVLYLPCLLLILSVVRMVTYRSNFFVVLRELPNFFPGGKGGGCSTSTFHL